MDNLRNLPEDKGENIARFFEMMKVDEHSVLRERRRSSLIPPSQEKLAIMEELPIQRSRVSSNFSGGNNGGIEKEEQPEIPKRSKFAICLSKREKAKLTAVSKLYPGQIHNIPLNDYNPLPRIKTEAEKRWELQKRLSYDATPGRTYRRSCGQRHSDFQHRDMQLQPHQKISIGSEEILNRSVSQQFDHVKCGREIAGMREQVPVTKAIARQRFHLEHEMN
ncbi:hypothetical protein FSP39_002909 [Pinctada imbricata]|uniref:Uncharacterized protein n=1 Tax=Pinctada imbricata TaxID=66713 RepID=A0AA88YRG5_PINIB|nr:hypothetical protein FSP39_002909 [Pinctada imbricata]